MCLPSNICTLQCILLDPGGPARDQVCRLYSVVHHTWPTVAYLGDKGNPEGGGGLNIAMMLAGP